MVILWNASYKLDSAVHLDYMCPQKGQNFPKWILSNTWLLISFQTPCTYSAHTEWCWYVSKHPVFPRLRMTCHTRSCWYVLRHPVLTPYADDLSYTRLLICFETPCTYPVCGWLVIHEVVDMFWDTLYLPLCGWLVTQRVVDMFWNTMYFYVPRMRMTCHTQGCWYVSRHPVLTPYLDDLSYTRLLIYFEIPCTYPVCRGLVIDEVVDMFWDTLYLTRMRLTLSHTRLLTCFETLCTFMYPVCGWLVIHNVVYMFWDTLYLPRMRITCHTRRIWYALRHPVLTPYAEDLSHTMLLICFETRCAYPLCGWLVTHQIGDMFWDTLYLPRMRMTCHRRGCWHTAGSSTNTSYIPRSHTCWTSAPIRDTWQGKGSYPVSACIRASVCNSITCVTYMIWHIPIVHHLVQHCKMI